MTARSLSNVHGGVETYRYLIPNSVRFRAVATANMTRTFGTGNAQKFTVSAWVKRGFISNGGAGSSILGANNTGSQYWTLQFDGSDRLQIQEIVTSSQYQLVTTRTFRDPSTWYHVVAAIDTSQAAARDRVKLWVNGEEITSWATYTQPSQNYNHTYLNKTGITHYVGGASILSWTDGSVAEVYMIADQQLYPDSFGYFNRDGVWLPRPYTGAYAGGTNSCYLKFNDGSSSSNLGLDRSPLGNNWTVNNVYTTTPTNWQYDWLTDTPTNNYAVWNTADAVPVTTFYHGTRMNFPGGNPATNGWFRQNVPMTYPTYFEVHVESLGGGNSVDYFSLMSTAVTGAQNPNQTYIWYVASNNGNVWCNSSQQSTGGLSAIANGDVLMFAVDPVNGKFWWGKGGTWANSGNPSTATNPSATGLPSTLYFGATITSASGVGSNWIWNINFGQRPLSYPIPTGYKTLSYYNAP